ncbi:PRC-barrel domain-containing protein [Patescibacteria group bacterium AH-259-L05]|nr:PRC-barrel domain-containing protein [Patescibacteria group bacterium AH-259-L05]
MQLKQLLNLDVYTQSGQYVGKIVDLEIDADTGHIITYIVKSSNVIKNLFQEKLLINQNQVISISSEKMMVEDASMPSIEAVPNPAQ